jgi:hypothetical protein
LFSSDGKSSIKSRVISGSGSGVKLIAWYTDKLQFFYYESNNLRQRPTLHFVKLVCLQNIHSGVRNRYFTRYFSKYHIICSSSGGGVWGKTQLVQCKSDQSDSAERAQQKKKCAGEYLLN